MWISQSQLFFEFRFPGLLQVYLSTKIKFLKVILGTVRYAVVYSLRQKIPIIKADLNICLSTVGLFKWGDSWYVADVITVKCEQYNSLRNT